MIEKDILNTEQDSVEKIAQSIHTPNSEQIVESMDANAEVVPVETPDIVTPENVIPVKENVFDDEKSVEVAGLFTKFDIPTIKPDDVEVRGKPRLDDDLVTVVDGKIFIKDAEPEMIKLLEETFQKSGVLDGKIKGKHNHVLINLDQIAGPDDVKMYAEAVAKAFAPFIEQAKAGKVDMGQLIKEASNIGNDEILSKIINLKPREQLKNAPEVLKANLVMIQQLHQTSSLAKLVSEGGTLPGKTVEETAIEFAKQAGFFKVVLAHVGGNNAEVARSLMILGHIKKHTNTKGLDSAENVKGLDELGQDMDLSLENITKHAQNFMLFTDSYKQTQFLKDETWLSKGGDVFSEIWINSLLSSPATHMVNIFSNTAFMMHKIPEVGVEGAVGSVRTKLIKLGVIPEKGIPLWWNFRVLGKGEGDRVYMGEMLALNYGYKTALWEAIQNMWTAFKTEMPTDMVTKMDQRVQKAITSENFGLDKNSSVGQMIDMLGMIYRGPGRFLVAEDEFFKTIAYRGEMHKIAYNNAMQVFEKTGDKKLAEEAYRQIITNPSNQVIEQATKSAQVATFQQNLDGFLGKIQGTMSHPVAKIWIPFYKTPTNIMLEVNKRLPTGIFQPSVLADLKAGGKRADKAMGKMIFGTGLVSTFMALSSGTMDSDVVITGGLPWDQAVKSTWKSENIPPYSIGIRMENGEIEWVSYARFEPLSALLAVSADMAWISNHSTADHQADLANILIAGGGAIYTYLSDMPFLQSVAEFSDLIGGQYESPTTRLERLKQLIAKQVGTAGLAIPTGPFGSIIANYERFMDPASSNVMATDTEGSAWFIGFNEAVQKWKSRTPYFSKDVEPALNFWGEVVTPDIGEFHWSYWTPFKIQNSKFNYLDTYLRENGIGYTMPPKTMDGIPMTATQYNDYIMLANTKTKTYYVNGIKKEMNMREKMQWDLMNNKLFRGLSLGDQEKHMNAIKSDYFSYAKEAILGKKGEIGLHPDLSNRINDRKNFMDEVGQSPPKGLF